MTDEDFLGDTKQLIHSSLNFNSIEEYKIVKSALIDKIPGDRE